MDKKDQTTLLPEEDLLGMEAAWDSLMLELAERFSKKMDLQTLLFLIGVQELGQLQRDFSKEEKQDLMHIAVCHLLSQDGYFRFDGRDEENWPHYTVLKPLPTDTKGLFVQEMLLKNQILKYFDKDWTVKDKG